MQTLDEIARDPQLIANQILVPIDDVRAEPHLTIDTRVRLDQAQKVRPRPAPHLGEHTDIVLHELGFDAAAIGKLRASGAIPQIQPEPKAA